MIKSLHISKPNVKVLLPFDKEKPFCAVKSFTTNIPVEDWKDHYITLHYNIINVNGTQENGFLDGIKHGNRKILDLRKAKEVIIYFTWSGEQKFDDFTIEIHYEIMVKLDTSIPTAGFDQHLANPRNIKILFSAPFGQGKTTFLNYYFDERLDKYNVFKLFPVNYSVATNQDVFRYIKSDILLQLLERTDIDFDKITQGYSDSFYSFFKKHPEKVLAPFLLMIPKIGKNLHGLYKELNTLKEAFFKFHDKQGIDGAELAGDFIKSLIEEEGSIYEDNFYSQLIRNLLTQLKERESGKENILLIDDLDRMDPDHIFRILNVLSAHYDSFHQNTTADNNKFGFDRIILVGDYENIRSIYEYRYGPKVDFGGYFNKYFSTEVFGFDNTAVFDKIISNINNDNQSLLKSYRAYHDIFIQLTRALVNNGALSLRELLKLREISFKRTIVQFNETSSDAVNYWFSNGVFSPIIAFLSKLGSPELLKQKLNQINLVHAFNLGIDLDEYCLVLVSALKQERTKKNFCIRENFHINFEIDKHWDHNYGVIKEKEIQDVVTKESLNNDAFKFSKKDFFDLLLANVDYYNSIKDRI